MKKFEGKVVNLTIAGTVSGTAVFLKDHGDQIEFQWFNVCPNYSFQVYPIEVYIKPRYCKKELIDTIELGPFLTNHQIFEIRDLSIAYDQPIFDRYQDWKNENLGCHIPF